MSKTKICVIENEYFEKNRKLILKKKNIPYVYPNFKFKI